MGIVSLSLALPACYFPCPLSISGWPVNLEMFLLISPDYFGDAVVTVTAHTAGNVGIEHKFGFVPERIPDGYDGIMG